MFSILLVIGIFVVFIAGKVAQAANKVCEVVKDERVHNGVARINDTIYGATQDHVKPAIAKAVVKAHHAPSSTTRLARNLSTSLVAHTVEFKNQVQAEIKVREIAKQQAAKQQQAS